MRLKRPPALSLFVLLVLSLLAVGCASFQADGPGFPIDVAVRSDREVGQTFVSRWDGLNGIELYLTDIDQGPESLSVSLYETPADEVPLWRGEVPIPSGMAPSWFTIPLDVQRGSAGRYYFVTIETESENTLKISTAPGGIYPEGSFYIDRDPQYEQLEHRLHYSLTWAVLGVAGDLGAAAGLLLVFGFLFTLPGWALFSAFWKHWPLQPLHSKLIYSSAAGLSVYPVLILWARLVRIETLPLLAWLVPLGAAGSFAWRLRRGSWRPERPDIKSALGLKNVWSFLIFYAILLTVLVTRLLPLRFLDAGMWGDSYHHTLIAQLLIDNGGLFSSWEPYASLITFTYHYGFHTGAALMSTLLDAPAHRTVLWIGQLSNFLAVAGLVPLADALLDRFRGESISRRKRLWVGSAVLIVAGLWSPQPMFYMNWGRYTQLLGQGLLVVWMAYSLDFFRSERRDWKENALAWLLLAGIGLTHYRVLIFAALWIAAYWLFFVRWRQIWFAASRIWQMGFGAVVLILPWAWIVLGGGLLFILRFQLATPASQAGEALGYYNQIGDLAAFLPRAVWALMAAGWIWAAVRRERGLLILAAWAVMLALSANPALLGLPGTGVVNNFSILIAMYIPAALTIGCGLLFLIERPAPLIVQRRPALAQAVLGAALAAIVIAGAVRQVGLIAPGAYALVTRSDLIAYEWLKANTPEDAVFLVNYFAAEGNNTVAGSDGGWWIPYFTGRESVLPPYIMISEVSKPLDLRQDLLELNARILAGSPAGEETVKALQAMGVTHVYLGQRQGAVGSGGLAISPFLLRDSETYSLIYQQDQVWIFRINPNPPD